MLSSGVNLKWTQEGRTANFICDGDTPIAFCKEAVFQFQAQFARIEEQIKAQQEAAKAQEPVPEVKEDPKPVEA